VLGSGNRDQINNGRERSEMTDSPRDGLICVAIHSLPPIPCVENIHSKLFTGIGYLQSLLVAGLKSQSRLDKGLTGALFPDLGY